MFHKFIYIHYIVEKIVLENSINFCNFIIYNQFISHINFSANVVLTK